MKDLKQHWKDFVGDPSEYLPHLFIACGLIVVIHMVGLTIYSHNL
jgi:hypothetical protein